MSATKLIFFSWAGNNFGQPFYSRWMQEFACLMNGNWYSTQAVSECKGEPDESCWWQLLSPVRGEVVVNGESSNDTYSDHGAQTPRRSATTLLSDAQSVAVNTATCANGRITDHLRSKHPECWQKCVGKDAAPGSLCSVSCGKSDSALFRLLTR